MALAGSGCSGDEGYFLYWSGRSYEAGGEFGKANRSYLRVLERSPRQKDPATGRLYGVQALARGLVLAAVEGEPDVVRTFLDVGDAFLDDRLEALDDSGQLLASAPGRDLGAYCLARALAEEGSFSTAEKLLREGASPAEGTFFENGQVHSLFGAWSELVRFVDRND